MSWVSVGIAAGTTAIGLIQRGNAKKKERKAEAESKRLFGERKAFKTPKEVLDLVGMSQNRAQSGFGPETIDYLTTQNDRATAGALGTAKQLGANPNDISGILDQSFQNIFRIGSEDQLMQMKNFDRLYNSIQLLGGNKDAEWASTDNLLKDQLQLQWAKAQGANVDAQSGTNLALSGLSSAATAYMYHQQNKDTKPPPATANPLLTYSPPPVSNVNAVNTPSYIKQNQNIFP